MKLVQIAGVLLLSSAGAAMANEMTPGASAGQSGTTKQETNTTTSSTYSQSTDKGAFGALDTNKDGYLTKMEAEQGGTVANFTSADRNGDGRLDSNEYAAVQAKSTSSSESSTSKSQSVTSSAPADDEEDDQ